MKTLQGTIISLKTAKTVTVLVERQWQHPVYKKMVKRTKKYACHYDDKQKLSEGMQVLIEESKPISKLKRFRVKEVIE